VSHPRFEDELKKRIAEELTRLREILENNASVTDIAQYKFLIGQIFAYHRVTDNYFDEVNTKLNEAK